MSDKLFDIGVNRTPTNKMTTTAQFKDVPNGTRFKLMSTNPFLVNLVCIKVDEGRFAELKYENGRLDLCDEVVRRVYGDFTVRIVEPGTK